MSRFSPHLLLGWALAAMLVLGWTGCDPESQDIVVEVHAIQWAQPDVPEEGATVVLEEQRLTNGVLNSFFTEIERQTTDATGVVTLDHHAKQCVGHSGACGTGRVFRRNRRTQSRRPVDRRHPQRRGRGGHAAVPGDRRHRQRQLTLSWIDVIYKWTPREVAGAASDVRWTCDTDWQAVGYGETENATCYVTGDTWLLHRRFGRVQTAPLDSVFCPKGGVVDLTLD